MAFTGEFGFPRTHLAGMMKIRIRDEREAGFRDLFEENRPGGDLPRVKRLREFLAPRPQMIRLRFKVSGVDGMGGDGEGSHFPHFFEHRSDFLVRGNKFLSTQNHDVGGTMIHQRIFRQFVAGNDEHTVLAPGALGFLFENFQIAGKRSARQRAFKKSRGPAQEGLLLTEVVRNCNRTETALAIQIDEFGNRELTVTKGGVDVEIAQHHTLTGYVLSSRVKVSITSNPCRDLVCRNGLPKMGRYFIAVVPDGLTENQELIQLVSKMKRTLRDREREVRWVRPDLWHVTLAFLGNLAIERHEELKALLSEWQPAGAAELNLRLSGVGGYPVEDAARVLWVGVAENQKFLDFQAELTTFLRDRAFELDSKPFHPHMTLARFRNAQSVSDLVELGGRKRFGDYKIRELILFESVLEGNILKYIPTFRRALP